MKESQGVKKALDWGWGWGWGWGWEVLLLRKFFQYVKEN